MAFHDTPIQGNIVLDTLRIWGHTYSKHVNILENLTFLTSRYKYVHMHIGAGGKGEWGEGKKCCFSGNFAYIL